MFETIHSLFQQKLQKKSKQMIASAHDNPILEMETLPSGRYQAVHFRVNL